MRFRGTLVLLLLCVGLAAFVYFYEMKGGEERERTKEEEEKIWDLDSAAIHELELVTTGSPITLARKEGGEWKITTPRPLDADSSEIDRLADAAAELKRESVVDSEATNLTRFGLEPPGGSLRINTYAGAVHKIRFGNPNPTGSSTYGLVEGTKEVLLVASSAAGAFRKSLEDLRNHSILKFDQYEAKSVELRHAKGAVQLEKQGDRWWIQAGERWAADSSAVNSILGSLANGRLQEFFNQDPEEIGNLGFDKPLLEVRVIVGEDKVLRHLQVGNEKAQILTQEGRPLSPGDSPEYLYIARDTSRSELFYIDRDLVDKMVKGPSDLRDQSLAVFQRWDVDTIILTNSEGALSFSKAGGDWLLGEEQKKTKWDAVNGILDALDRDVARFIDDPGSDHSYGLEPPRLRVVLKKGEEMLLDCRFGRETSEGIFAKVTGESAVKIAVKEVFEDLGRSVADYVIPTGSPQEAKEPPRER